MGSYTCIPPCNRSFAAAGPLTRHQARCRVWDRHEAQAATGRRNAASLRSKTAREKLCDAQARMPGAPQVQPDRGEVPMMVETGGRQRGLSDRRALMASTTKNQLRVF
ncbi:hypothetical protein BJ322DRAFT_1016715 [Thelephora terrestris]|uniref:C2H2-type domain-containing protein n=1 Tax=Thelephora terrestris TaxID=56493 RepID=A0A9P6LDG6_9AGAM|nr:hypothetical protein BJ322DRAFT_1016715 [Thelephora terrestris]